jgi:hypothetical protein
MIYQQEKRIMDNSASGKSHDIDVSSTTLGAMLAQSGEGDIDHTLAFASRKISTTEINYTTTEREGLAMVYALQKFLHYLLGGHFKMFIDHFALNTCQ